MAGPAVIDGARAPSARDPARRFAGCVISSPAMAGIDGKRRSGDDGAGLGGARSDAAGGGPGKSTLTGALSRGMAPRTPVDVSDPARAAVGSVFGPAAGGVDYAVGGGAAEARGVNAVTADRKVDFAPDQFDLASHAGRARLGEETAHAVQQGNRGDPSAAPALEGEAKQAGEDFASGRTPKVERAAPAGLALADDPKGKDQPAKDTDPSPEVPDLQNGEVAAIKKVWGSQDDVLKELLKALQRINATAFDSSDLEGGVLHAGGGSRTRQGPKFQTWLETTLDAHAKTLKKKTSELKGAEVKAALKATPVPAASKDISVTIGSGHFASLPLLYSTVRHEFVHVAQLRPDMTGYIPTNMMPAGLDSPSTSSTGNDRELEAYQWEMEHLAGTGLKDTGELFLLWDKSSDAWMNASPAARTKVDPQYGKAFNNVWGLAMDGHVAAIDTAYQAFKKAGKLADESAVRELQRELKLMWKYGGNFGNKPASREPSYKAALAQTEEMLGSAKADAFKKLLDQADAELKTGYKVGDDAYDTWEKLTTRWINLDADQVKSFKARFEVTGPALWDKAFTLYEAEILKRIQDGGAGEAKELLEGNVARMFLNAAVSLVKAADYKDRHDKLKAAVKKAVK